MRIENRYTYVFIGSEDRELDIQQKLWCFNPSHAEATAFKAQGCRDFCKPSKPSHVGIHWIALTEYSQMSTHVPGFQ